MLNVATISWEELLNDQEIWGILDVRSPKEFEHAHVHGAQNLPLFSNDERHEVGTLYKQQGRNVAVQRGLEYVGPKLGTFSKTLIEQGQKHPKLAIHCWRGGMRSQSMAWLANLVGAKVHTIESGYKAYRQFTLKLLSNIPQEIFVVSGNTGAGKTEVLQALAQLGETIIDLEKLAGHRGSVFGHIGARPRGQEQFENDLGLILHRHQSTSRIWIEDESRVIGQCHLPEALWQKKLASPHFALDVSPKQRLKRILRDYEACGNNELWALSQKLRRRLGDERLKEIETAIQESRRADAITVLLGYYDRGYAHARNNKGRRHIVDLRVPEGESAIDTAQKLIAASEHYSPPLSTPLSKT